MVGVAGFEDAGAASSQPTLGNNEISKITNMIIIKYLGVMEDLLITLNLYPNTKRLAPILASLLSGE